MRKKTSTKTKALIEQVTRTDKLEEEILRFLRKKTNASLYDLGEEVDATLRDIKEAVVRLQDLGYQIDLDDTGIRKQTVTEPGGFRSHIQVVQNGEWVKVGMISDNQLGNKTARTDVLATAYDHYESEGITNVYNAGNVIDGYNPRINAFELLPEAGPSIERQCKYAAQVYPKKEGIDTHFVTGDCHEGWYSRGNGLNVGKAMRDRFIENDREDLEYVGHIEADIELRPDGLPKGVRGPILRLTHPGGGTAYAKSYKTQKWAESLQGGEKPQVALVGHYHKSGYFVERNIHCFLAGCTSDQSIFMRKHNIPAEVGYWILAIKVNRKDGAITRVNPEWVPFFDKGYYQNYERF